MEDGKSKGGMLRRWKTLPTIKKKKLRKAEEEAKTSRNATEGEESKSSVRLGSPRTGDDRRNKESKVVPSRHDTEQGSDKEGKRTKGSKPKGGERKSKLAKKKKSTSKKAKNQTAEGTKVSDSSDTYVDISLVVPLASPAHILKKSGTNYCTFINEHSSDDEDSPLSTEERGGDNNGASNGGAPLYTDPGFLVVPDVVNKERQASGEASSVLYTEPGSLVLEEEDGSGSPTSKVFYDDLSSKKALYLDLSAHHAYEQAKKRKNKGGKGSKREAVPPARKTPKKKRTEEDDLEALLKAVDPATLKAILLSHAKDHRAHVLSYVQESLKEAKSKTNATKMSVEGGAAVRDWSGEYYNLLNDGMMGLTPEAVKQLSDLTHDFVECATTYAKIIVNELSVDILQKQIKPIDIGGLAGGEKYIAGGILFKFCLDKQLAALPKPLYMYGGDRPNDELAMKVGGLELQGLEIWQSSLTEGLHFPMTCLLDYKGYRLIASSMLPIDKETLRYGSSDGGKTVVADDPKLFSLIEKAAKMMNLKEHTVGKKKVPLYGPGDIEGHKGKDGRYYLLDFARTMPPEAPEWNDDGTPKIPRGVFYRMLRPELVKSNPVPLSSDVFSGWGAGDINREVSQNEVQAATKRILTEAIPAVVNELQQLDVDKVSGFYFTQPNTTPKLVKKFLNEINLAFRMHSKGVNLRYLGVIRQQLDLPRWKALLLSLAVARTLKTVLRRMLRELARRNRSEMACKQLVAMFFNTVLFGSAPVSSSTASDSTQELREGTQWGGVDLVKELLAKYPGILTKEEEAMPLTAPLFCPRLAICECLHLNIMKLSPRATKVLFSTTDWSSVELLDSDIVELCCNTRYPLMFNLYDALHFAQQAKRKLGGERQLLLASYLVEMAASLGEDSLPVRRVNQPSLQLEQPQELASQPETAPSCWSTKRLDPLVLKKKQARSLLLEANERLLLGNTSSPLCPYTGLLWGDVLSDLAETYNKWPKINRCLEQAYDKFATSQAIVGPYLVLHMLWASVLQRHAERAQQFGHSELAESLYRQAEAKLAKLGTIEKKLPCDLAEQQLKSQQQTKGEAKLEAYVAEKEASLVPLGVIVVEN